MGYFFLPVWMTCTWIAGYYVHSGRTSGNKMRNSIQEDYIIFFLLTTHHSFLPIIPTAEHFPEEIALSHSYPLVSASVQVILCPLWCSETCSHYLQHCQNLVLTCANAQWLLLGHRHLPKAELDESLSVSLSVLKNAKLSLFSRNYSPGKKINVKALENTRHNVFSLSQFIFRVIQVTKYRYLAPLETPLASEMPTWYMIDRGTKRHSAPKRLYSIVSHRAFGACDRANESCSKTEMLHCFYLTAICKSLGKCCFCSDWRWSASMFCLDWLSSGANYTLSLVVFSQCISLSRRDIEKDSSSR